MVPALRRSIHWTFVIADRVNPLLGANFIHHFEIIVDGKNCRLMDKATKCYCSTRSVSNKNISINEFGFPEIVKPLFDKYLEVLTPRYSQSSDCSKVKVKHCIDTGNTVPTFAKVRQLSTVKQEAAKKEFSSLLQAVIIRQCKSPWFSPLLYLVPKSAPRSWRACGDYRTLNSTTKPDRYPIPNIHSVASRLEYKTIFTKLDLLQARYGTLAPDAPTASGADITLMQESV